MQVNSRFIVGNDTKKHSIISLGSDRTVKVMGSIPVIRSGRTRKPEFPTIPENLSMRMPSREVRTLVSKYSINRTLQEQDVTGKFPPSAHA
jgi:hypothetical protein